MTDYYTKTIKAETIWRIETRKWDKNHYWMRQSLKIDWKYFDCSLAYIDYRKNFEFMVFDENWEVYCEMWIEDFTKEALKDYMQDFTLWYIQNALN